MTNSNSAAQAAEPQTILSFDERERILCQFMGEPINHDREMAIAIETAVLSKLRAPVSDIRKGFELTYAVDADDPACASDLSHFTNGWRACMAQVGKPVVMKIEVDATAAIDRINDGIARMRAPVAGQPFMCGIMGPDGKAHFEELCVSGDRDELQAEIVDHLNRDNPEDRPLLRGGAVPRCRAPGQRNRFRQVAKRLRGRLRPDRGTVGREEGQR